MQSLFPVQQRGAFGASRQPPALVSFKAGKCIFSDRQSNGKFLITPDKRRGTISLIKSNDGLVHFQWTDRNSGRIEDNRILFPDDANFKKVNTGKEADRVYMLKMRGVAQPWMFWMQDKSAEKDTENASKINEYANNPAAADAALAAINAAAAPTGGLGGSMAGGLSAEQWAQMMGLPVTPGAFGAPAGAAATGTGAVPGASSSGNGASAPALASVGAFGNLDLSSILGAVSAAPASTSTAAPSSAVNLPPTAAANTSGTRALTAEDLRAAMMSLGSPAAGNTTQSASLAALAAAQERERMNRIQLTNILDPDEVLATGILNDPEVRAALIEHLPEGQRNEESLEPTLRSAQFRQSLRSLSAALQGDNFSTIMANLSLDPSPGTEHLIRGDAVRAFIAALQASEDRAAAATQESTSSASSAPNGGNQESKDDESKMQE